MRFTNAHRKKGCTTRYVGEVRVALSTRLSETAPVFVPAPVGHSETASRCVGQRGTKILLGRHLYLSLSRQVVPWESDREGSYGSQSDDHGLLCISPRTPVPMCILISAPRMHAGP